MGRTADLANINIQTPPFLTVNNLLIVHYHIDLGHFVACFFHSVSVCNPTFTCDYLVNVCLPYYTKGHRGRNRFYCFSLLPV